MKFDLWGVVLMIVAIALGQFIGGYLQTMLGGNFSGGIIGALIVGVICYFIYAFLTSTKFSFAGMAIFAVLIYIANLGAGYVAEAMGLGGGFLTLIIAGVVASVLWGWIGGKSAKRGKAGALKSPIKI